LGKFGKEIELKQTVIWALRKICFFDVNPETKEINKKESFTPPPHEPGLYPRLLGEKGADIIIAGGMGPRAQELFNENGVK